MLELSVPELFKLFDLCHLSFVGNVALLWQLYRIKQQNRSLQHCPIFGILNRQAIDLRWQQVGRRYKNLSIIFLDVDRLKQANTYYGYDGANDRIRAALSQFRTDEVFRWLRGDEIVLLVHSHDAKAVADRVSRAFREYGLSATIGVAQCRYSSLKENVRVASDLVQSAKENGKRGMIFVKEDHQTRV